MQYSMIFLLFFIPIKLAFAQSMNDKADVQAVFCTDGGRFEFLIDKSANTEENRKKIQDSPICTEYSDASPNFHANGQEDKLKRLERSKSVVNAILNPPPAPTAIPSSTPTLIPTHTITIIQTPSSTPVPTFIPSPTIASSVLSVEHKQVESKNVFENIRDFLNNIFITIKDGLFTRTSS